MGIKLSRDEEEGWMRLSGLLNHKEGREGIPGSGSGLSNGPLSSSPLPSPRDRAHRRMMMKRRRSRVLAAASTMSTSTTSAPAPDFPAGKRREEHHLLNGNAVSFGSTGSLEVVLQAFLHQQTQNFLFLYP